jgi:putative nucleotidyltransferase with HDIG domain
MTREQAWQLLCEFTQSESLRKHGLAVETCMAAYARQYGEDELKWSICGLLHDFDWEIHPVLPDHPMKGQLILTERGVDPEIRRAILAHASLPEVPRLSLMEHALFACDELAGFLTAISYVKPRRSIHEVDVASVRKKMKDKAFARAVNRDDITNGAAGLGVPIDQHIEFCIRAMQANASALGLQAVVAP